MLWAGNGGGKRRKIVAWAESDGWVERQHIGLNVGDACGTRTSAAFAWHRSPMKTIRLSLYLNRRDWYRMTKWACLSEPASRHCSPPPPTPRRTRKLGQTQGVTNSFPGVLTDGVSLGLFFLSGPLLGLSGGFARCRWRCSHISHSLVSVSCFFLVELFSLSLPSASHYTSMSVRSWAKSDSF